MIQFICDKCGEQIGINSAYRIYSFSKGKLVTLCAKCLKAHNKAIEKADKKFFKKGEMKDVD